jgi:signal transduction histidine kinase
VLPHIWIGMIVAGGYLALGIAVLAKRMLSPLAIPLALLCLDMFAWNIAALADEVSNDPAWHHLDIAISPFAPPLALHLTIAFIGRTRNYRALLIAAYAGFALLSLASIVSEFDLLWYVGFVVLLAPTTAFALGLLISHERRTIDAIERKRARMMLGAFAMSALLAPTELFDQYVPPVGTFGTLVSMALVAVVAFRLRVFGRDLTTAGVAYAVVVAIVTVVGAVVLFRLLGGNTAMAVFGAAVVVVVLAVTARELLARYGAQREQLARLATMGRFAAQLAHDLKNPLAALKGSLEFLQEERARGRSLDAHGEFLDLMKEQVTRAVRVLNDYERIARVEPILRDVNVNEIARGVLALQTVAAPSNVEVRLALANDVPRCALDADLVAGALENLMKNALEAMPKGGTLSVRIAADRGGIVIAVEDTGEGIDPRYLEKAFDDFFTTKTRGSGLGLAFVRRVAHAHGGDVTIESSLGQGTKVEMTLPVRGAA